MKIYIWITLALILILIFMQSDKKIRPFDDYFKAVFDVETERNNIHKMIVDSGGLTKYGISDLADKVKDGKYFGEDIARMTILRASQIYQSNYFTPFAIYFKNYPDLCLQIFDVAINSGSGKAKQMLLDVLGVKNVGEALIKIESLGESKVLKMFKDARLKFYESLANSNPEKYAKYLKGWKNRLLKLKFLN